MIQRGRGFTGQVYLKNNKSPMNPRHATHLAFSNSQVTTTIVAYTSKRRETLARKLLQTPQTVGNFLAKSITGDSSSNTFLAMDAIQELIFFVLIMVGVLLLVSQMKQQQVLQILAVVLLLDGVVCMVIPSFGNLPILMVI